MLAIIVIYICVLLYLFFATWSNSLHHYIVPDWNRSHFNEIQSFSCFCLTHQYLFCNITSHQQNAKEIAHCDEVKASDWLVDCATVNRAYFKRIFTLDSDLTQQRLQPIPNNISPLSLAIAMVVIGIFFIPAGTELISQAKNVRFIIHGIYWSYRWFIIYRFYRCMNIK